MENPCRRARALEERFIAHAAESLQQLGEVLDPSTGKRAPFSADALEWSDERPRIKDAMVARGLFDKEKLAEMPMNRAACMRIEGRGVLSRTTALTVALASLSPVEALLDGQRDALLGAADLARLAGRLELPADEPCVLGALAPLGWEQDEKIGGALSETCALYLAQPGRTGAVEVRAAGRNEKADAFWREIFCPDGPEALAREAAALFLAHRRLRARGGYLELRAAARETGLDENVALDGFRLACRENPELTVESLAGKTVLKRKRF